MKKHLGTVLKLALTISALTYLFVSDKLRLEELVVEPGGWPSIGAAVGMIFGWTIVSLVRYWWLLRSAEVELTVRRVMQVGFISWFFNASLLGGLGFVSGDAIKAGYLVREKGQGSAIIGATLVDRTLGILGLLTLAVFALQVGWEQTVQSEQLRRVAAVIYGLFATAGLAILLAAVSLALGRLAAVAAWLLFGGAAMVLLGMVWDSILVPGLMMLIPLAAAVLAPALLPGGGLHRVIVERIWMGRHIGALLTAVLDYRKRPGGLLGGYALSLLVHILALIAIVLTGRGISIAEEPSLRQVWFAAPPATALNVLPLPANGLGVGEATFDTLLRFCAGPGGDPLAGGAALYLSYRILLTLAGLSGLPCYLVSRKGESPDRSGSV